MDDDTGVALQDLVLLADSLPGEFRPEFELGYWSGVSDGAESWCVRFEGDMQGTEFTVLGFTAAQALRKSGEEALRRRAALGK